MGKGSPSNTKNFWLSLVIYWCITNSTKTWCLKIVTILLFFTMQWVRNSCRSQLASDSCGVCWGWNVHDGFFIHMSCISVWRSRVARGWLQLFNWGHTSEASILIVAGFFSSLLWNLRAPPSPCGLSTQSLQHSRQTSYLEIQSSQERKNGNYQGFFGLRLRMGS